MVDVHRKEWFEGGGMPPFKSQIKIKWSLVALLIPVLLVLWLATGIYIVQPGEQGVVRRFGKAVRKTEPGPHFHFPAPIEQVDTVAVQKVRRLEIGFRTTSTGTPAVYQSRLEESLMLTGDEQIVDAQMIVQYQIKSELGEVENFLFNVRNLEDPKGVVGTSKASD